MDSIDFKLSLFENEQDVERSKTALKLLLMTLVAIDLDYLKTHPLTPPLYQAGVKYMREPPGREWWQDIPTTLKLRNGDCEDLAAWRTAELLHMGADAKIVLRERRMIEGNKEMLRFHIIVYRPDTNAFEDPSLFLGMGKEDYKREG